MLIAGNAIARGGVSLAAVAASCGVAATCLILAPRNRRRGTTSVTTLAIGLGAAVLVIGMQLVPLPPVFVRLLSPRTDATLRDALGPIGLYPSWRPITLDPGTTALELSKAATFAMAAAAGAILGGSDRRRDRLLRWISLSGVATVAVYYVAALVGRSPLLEPRITFVNPNHLAGFLQIAAWPALGFALRARGPSRAGWLLAFTFTASGIFLSLSRAGIAAFFVGMGIFAVLRMRTIEQRRSSRGVDGERTPPHPDPLPRDAGERGVDPDALARAVSGQRGVDPDALARVASGQRGFGHRIRSRTVVALGVSGALAVVSWLALDQILTEMSTVADEATTAVKLEVWPIALRMIRDFPAVGIGRGAFWTTFPSYKWEPLQRTFTHVENEWLQLPLELGVVAGLGVVALFAWAFVAAVRRRDLSRPLAGALAGAGALVAHNLFDFSLEIPGVAIPFAVVLGIASREMPSIEIRPWLVRAAAGAMFALGAIGLLVHGAHGLDSDAASVVEAASGDDAVARARAALRWHPADYLPPAVAGTRLVVEGRCREAIPWLVRAMERSPTAPEPHRATAHCLAAAGRAALAKREFRLAFSYGDRSALEEAHAWYAQPGALLEVAPDTPEGLAAAGAILRDDPAQAAVAWQRAWDSFKVPWALAQLASAKVALHQDEDALALARQLEQGAPQNPYGYVVAARALDELGRGDDAQKELELGAARLPGSFEVLAALGVKHLASHRFSQARATFDGIVAVEGPVLARKRILVARALEGQGRYQEALAEARVARGLLPADASVLVAFSRIAEAVGLYDEAVDSLEVAARQPATKPGTYDAKLAALKAARDEQQLRKAVWEGR